MKSKHKGRLLALPENLSIPRKKVWQGANTIAYIFCRSNDEESFSALAHLNDILLTLNRQNRLEKKFSDCYPMHQCLKNYKSLRYLLSLLPSVV